MAWLNVGGMGPETGATVEVTYVGVLADASNGQVEDFRESGVLISSASEVLEHLPDKACSHRIGLELMTRPTRTLPFSYTKQEP